MARESRINVVGSRAQPQDIGKVRLEVNARPVDRTMAPARSSASQLADALAAASPGFRSYFDAKQKEYAESETAKGIKDAQLSEGDTETLIKDGKINREQSPYYQKAFMEQAGVVKGYQQWEKMWSAYENGFDKDVGDINQFISDNLGADLNGLDDNDFAKGYLSVMAEKEQVLRKSHLEYVTERQKEAAQTGFNSVVANRLADARTNDPDIEIDFKEITKAFEEQGKKLGLSNEEVMDNILRSALTSLYDEEGNAYPNVLDIFYQGGVGVGAMGSNPAYMSTIANAKQAAEKIKHAKETEVNSLAAAKLYNGLNKLAEKGLLTEKEAFANIVSDENPNGLTSSQVNTLLAKSRSFISGQVDNSIELAGDNDVQLINSGNSPYSSLEEIHKAYPNNQSVRRRVVSAFQSNYNKGIINQSLNGFISDNNFVGARSGYTPTDIKKAVDNQFIQEAGVNGEEAAINTVLRRVNQTNDPLAIPSVLTSTVMGASPKNSDSWNNGYEMWKRFHSEAPVLLNTLSGNEKQAIRFTQYHSMITELNMEPDVAREALVNADRPEVKERVAAMLQEDKGYSEIKDAVDEEFKTGGIMGWFRTTPDNINALRTQAIQFAKTIATVDPDLIMGREAVIEATINHMKSKYAPSGSSYVRVETPEQLHPDYSNGVANYIDMVTNRMGDDANPGGYTARPHPRDKSKLMLMENIGGMPARPLTDSNGNILVVPASEVIRQERIRNGDILVGDDLKRENTRNQISELEGKVSQLKAELGWELHGNHSHVGTANTPEEIAQVEESLRITEQALSEAKLRLKQLTPDMSQEEADIINPQI